MFGWGIDTKTFNISPTKKFMSENNILNSCLFITLHDRKNDDLKDIVKNFLCFAPEISKKLVKKFEKLFIVEQHSVLHGNKIQIIIIELSFLKNLTTLGSHSPKYFIRRIKL